MVCFLLADGFEEIELITPVDILKRVGENVKLVSITEDKIVRGSHNVYISTDMNIDEVDIDDVEMVVLPGGMPGTTNLLKSQKVIQMIKKVYNEDKYVCAICAAPMVLDEAGLIVDKKVTCYPAVKENIKTTVATDKDICHDGKIITSKAAGTAMDFAFYLAEILKTKVNSDEVKKDIYYAK